MNQLYTQRQRLPEQGDYDRAIADYNEAIRLDPKYGAAYANLDIACRNKNSLGGSTSLFDRLNMPEADFKEPIGPPAFDSGLIKAPE
jgi:tetratricopeptide (TPR) repeat protein